MIKNKIIEIKKNNTFEKSWALFIPIDIKYQNDVDIYTIKELENKITFATHIDLVIANNFIHKRLFEAILWSYKQGGLTLNLIYKNEDILLQFKGIEFDRLKKKNDLTINYMCIYGKKANQNYVLPILLEEDIIKLDNPLKMKESKIKEYSFLSNYDEITIIDYFFEGKYANLIKICQEKNIKINYVINTQNFSQDMHNKFKDLNINLMVCNKITPATILKNKATDELFCLKFYENTDIIFKISSLKLYIQDEIYLNNTKKISIEQLPKDYFIFDTNKIVNQYIMEEKEICIKIQCTSMEDFINEKFDRSITNNHNQYSPEFKMVKYIFTLNPPRFDKSYKVSSLYNGINQLSIKIQELDDSVIKNFAFEVENLLSKNWIEVTIKNILEIKCNILKKIKNYQYDKFNDYYVEVLNFLVQNKQRMYDEILNMYKSVLNGIEEKKFSKIDREINEYKQIIKDKEKLILENINFLDNKRRVETLKTKIKELEELKQKFESNNLNRNEKYLCDFKIKYAYWINKKQINILTNDSIEKIIDIKNVSIIEKVDSLLDKYLTDFNNYYDNFITLLNQIKKQLIFPLQYIVYEKENKNYVLIDNLEEYKNLKEMCNKYNLLTLAKE